MIKRLLVKIGLGYEPTIAIQTEDEATMNQMIEDKQLIVQNIDDAVKGIQKTVERIVGNESASHHHDS